jgi:steroid 5-alpha reductase family enzyme
MMIPSFLYGCIPAPFFVIDGVVSPLVLMEKVPAPVFFAVALLCACGGFYAGWIFDMLVEAILPVAVHWCIFFVHALPQRSEKYFDLAGQLAFLTAAIWSLIHSQLQRQQICVTMLCLCWSIRLGGFLYLRMLERKSDFRFVEARAHPGYLFFAWTCQGLWAFFVGLPLYVINADKSTVEEQNSSHIRVVEAVSFLFWAAGLAIESVADHQKLCFVRQHPRDRYDLLVFNSYLIQLRSHFQCRKVWIDTGLWRFSRHPNYFGEMLVWVGVYGMGCGSYHDLQTHALAAVSPLFEAIFLMQTSLPWLEKVADKKFGEDKKYQEYKQRTSILILLPPRG